MSIVKKILKKIEISGYRGFQQKASLDFAEPNGKEGSGLTIITGPNSSGKSSILECLRMRSAQEEISFTIGTRNAATDFVSIKFYLNDSIETITSTAQGTSETKKNIGSDFEIFVVPSRRVFNPYFDNNHSLSRADYQSQGFTYNSLRSSTLTGFEQRLFKIHNSPEKEKEKFNKMLSEVLGFDTSWTIDRLDSLQYFLKFYNQEYWHSSEGIGEGIVSIFSIVDSLYDSEPGSFIAIDEPELSLHPSLQKRVNNLFLEQSKDKQIVISTHSPYFVDISAINNGAHLARVTTTATGTKINQLTEDSRINIKKLSTRNLNNPHILGLDARELFFLEDKIILTEGQEDVVLFPKVFKALEKELNANLFGWGAGGASNIYLISKILQDLGFSKVVGIFDNDRQDDLNKCKQQYSDYHFTCIPAEDIRNKKAQKAKNTVEGLLNEDFKVKNEYIKDTKEMIDSLQKYLD